MQSLNDILHVARENNYSDVHLGGQNNIMIRNNGIRMSIHIQLMMLLL